MNDDRQTYSRSCCTNGVTTFSEFPLTPSLAASLLGISNATVENKARRAQTRLGGSSWHNFVNGYRILRGNRFLAEKGALRNPMPDRWDIIWRLRRRPRGPRHRTRTPAPADSPPPPGARARQSASARRRRRRSTHSTLRRNRSPPRTEPRGSRGEGGGIRGLELEESRTEIAQKGERVHTVTFLKDVGDGSYFFQFYIQSLRVRKYKFCVANKDGLICAPDIRDITYHGK